MKMNGAELIMRLLERQGIGTVPGIPGGANLPLYDALRGSRIRHVLARHEQGAGFIAQGLARATGRPAVCFGTSGPGATNLLTAIADAKLDSIPLVAITGQVPTGMIGTDAFQEIDTYGLTIPTPSNNYLFAPRQSCSRSFPMPFASPPPAVPGPVVVDVQRTFRRSDRPRRLSGARVAHRATAGRGQGACGVRRSDQRRAATRSS